MNKTETIAKLTEDIETYKASRAHATEADQGAVDYYTLQILKANYAIQVLDGLDIQEAIK